MDAVAGAARPATGSIDEPKGLVSRRWSQVVLAGAGERTARIARSMTSAPAMLALVTDAFGGRGGIAQYNRDLLERACLTSEAWLSSITVLPRHAPDQAIPPSGILQMPPRPGRIAYVPHGAGHGAHPAGRRRVLRTSLHGATCGADRPTERCQTDHPDPRDRGLAAAVATSARGAGDSRSRLVRVALHAGCGPRLGCNRA